MVMSSPDAITALQKMKAVLLITSDLSCSTPLSTNVTMVSLLYWAIINVISDTCGFPTRFKSKYLLW